MIPHRLGRRTQAGLESIEPRVHVEVAISEIYSHSPVRLRAWSDRRFTLGLTGTETPGRVRILKAEKGRFQGPGSQEIASCSSASDDEDSSAGVRSYVECMLGGVLHEERISARRWPSGAQSRLGVRWYPFVSARLQLALELKSGCVASLEVAPGSDIRLRGGYTIEASVEPRLTLEHQNRLEANAWAYSLWWPSGQGASSLPLDIPVQTAPNVLARHFYGTAMSLATAFVAIGVAGHLDENSAQLSAAALGAFLLLLGRQWTAVPRVHHVTAMAGIYLASALMAVPWALGWGQQDGDTWWWILPAGGWVSFLVSAVPYFETHGRPPPVFAVPWRYLSRALEISRDTVRARWALRTLLEGFPGRRVIVLDSSADILRIGTQTEGVGGSSVRDEVAIRRQGGSFVVVRRSPAGTASTRIYPAWVLRRELSRVAIDSAAMQHLRELEKLRPAND